MTQLLNVQTLENALDYLAKVIEWRMDYHFGSNESVKAPMPHLPDEWLSAETPLNSFIRKHKLDTAEQLTLLMAIAPHLQPDFFDRLITANLPQAGDYPQIGGWRGKAHRGFLPTGETVLFMLGGDRFAERLRLQQMFSEEHPFARDRVIYLDSPAEGEPMMSGKLVMLQDYVELFTQGSFSRPHFSINFPAQRITTEMEWEDLVLNTQTLQQIHELEAWITHSRTILYDWNMKKKLKLGYRALFYGPPGTGKTLTASLLGKYTGKDVYKIDISMVVSKFIGETEKNLANLFARAESKDWILFFDEADALFGKRTNVRDAHDKYANQEVSYLLQRIENYDGLVILSSNLKSNIDEAFIRRFQSIIQFPIPNVKERSQLWQMAFPSQIKLAESVDLPKLSAAYELTGSDILNIVQHCCLQALQRGDAVIHHEDILDAIKRELNKAGKIM
ncbi:MULTISPECIES: ATP-binding protein [unclassified Tolypothrix]|uniref:ATP-binding protein n=1 Tax=unclassified Tolypothrix TaxID=2649714 RepID=UPI000B14C7C9|nr:MULTISPECIES: AAA family ATPase [unclassified Tolypothrix]BAY90671.1 AAA superfamily ATPase [Microchaete diplosiphon NIES-3275]